MIIARRPRLIGFALAAVAFGLDRIAKALVVGPLALTQEGQSLYVLPFFNLTRENNHGVSLSLLQATSDEARWLLVAGTTLIALVVLVWLVRERRLGEILPLGLILGGAASNILDRIRHGYVVDYADLHFGEWRPFLIFNVADAAISIGVVIILARALFMREKPPAPHGPEANDRQADLPAENS